MSLCGFCKYGKITLFFNPGDVDFLTTHAKIKASWSWACHLGEICSPYFTGFKTVRYFLALFSMDFHLHSCLGGRATIYYQRAGVTHTLLPTTRLLPSYKWFVVCNDYLPTEKPESPTNFVLF